MKRILQIALIGLIFLVHCSTPKATTQITETDYKIYSVALDSLFSSGKPIVLRDSLALGYHRDNQIIPFLTSDSQKLQFPIEEDKLSLKSKVYLFSYPDLIRVMKEGDDRWDAFYLQFPNSVGWITLSTIHRKKGVNEAIFVVELACGPYCGGSYEIRLMRKNEEWVVLEILQFGEA